MTKPQSLLKKSFDILNSCLVLVLVTYLVDVIYARLLYLNRGFLAMAVVIPAKIYIYSGIYGMLIELGAGEELVVRLHNFQKNAREFWRVVLPVMGLPAVVHIFAEFLSLNPRATSLYAFYAHLNVLLSYLVAWILIKRKYLRPQGLPERKVRVNMRSAATLLLLYFMQLFVFYLPYNLNTGNFELTRITALWAHYLQWLVFLYAVAIMLRQYPEIEKNFVFEKEIYLINPAGGSIFFYLITLISRSYPTVFAILKALTPKHYRFREFNRHSWGERYYAGGKLVAITCYTSTSSDAYRIAMEFRRRGSTVVMGGPHVTFMPEEALEYCDSVVIGEAESVWPELIRDYENRSLKKRYVGVPLEECYSIVYEELLNSSPAIIRDSLETTRGCKYHCRFCAIPGLSHGRVRTQPVSQVVALLRKIRPTFRHVLFNDNNIYTDPVYARELFNAIKPLRIKWSTQCSIDIAGNEEMLRLAKESGCHTLLVGFEISDASAEKQQGGKLAIADKYREYARRLRKMGIAIKAHFIIGFESDCFKTLLRIWRLAFAMQSTFTVISVLTPFPGTAFYDDMVRQDRITNLNWRNYNCQHLVFQHERLNRRLLMLFWPTVNIIFLFTTSRCGYLLLVVLALHLAGVIF